MTSPRPLLSCKSRIGCSLVSPGETPVIGRAATLSQRILHTSGQKGLTLSSYCEAHSWFRFERSRPAADWKVETFWIERANGQGVSGPEMFHQFDDLQPRIRLIGHCGVDCIEEHDCRVGNEESPIRVGVG